jgi:hypothetical protein
MVRMLKLMACGAAMVLVMAASASASASAGAGDPLPTKSGAQSPAVVVFFGVGEQVFDVGPLPELGRAGKKSAKKKVRNKSKKKSKKKSRKKAGRRRNKPGWMYGYRAGYRCQVLLVFWAYMHRWGCKPVVARNQVVLSASNQYQTAQLLAMEKAVAETYKLSDHKLSWWGRNGRYVVGGILILLILSGLIKRMRRRRY